MSKDELCKAADPHCDISMTHTNPGHAQYYNGYSSVTKLIEEGLVIRSGRPQKIWLTPAGTALAGEILERRALAHQMVYGNASAARFNDPSVADNEIPAMDQESFAVPALPKNWNVQPREKNKKPR